MMILNQENFAKTSKGTWVIDFSAEWCAPCRYLAPIFESISEKFKDLNFCKVDVERSNGLANKFAIMSIPTIIILKNGKEVSRKVGFMNEEQLERWLRENAY
jgi:thioredoxin